jgi:uncharacterized protein
MKLIEAQSKQYLMESQMLVLTEPINLSEVLSEVQAKIAPLWPLKDYVAVNPFLGFSDERFLNARQQLRRVRPVDMLMPTRYYRELLSKEVIGSASLRLALAQCKAEYPNLYDNLTEEQIVAHVFGRGGEPQADVLERRFRTCAEAIDDAAGTLWSNGIVDDVSHHCAAHFDSGQSLWPSPWRNLSLFQAWREASLISRKFEKKGILGFRAFVRQIPADPASAVEFLLHRLDVPRAHWQEFLLCQLLSVAGWASYVKYRVSECEKAGSHCDDLLGLLAMRLAYDVALDSAGLVTDKRTLWPDEDVSHHFDAHQASPVKEKPCHQVLARYAVQVAAEIAYRTSLFEKMSPVASHAKSVERKAAQMVFCIDVRSEVIRRHLESVSSKIQTFGFAGFFGLPIEFVALGETNGTAQCPVLLSPAITIHETIRGADSRTLDTVRERRGVIRRARGVWKSFKQSGASCFTFVESMGMLYAFDLVANTFRRASGPDQCKHDGVHASYHDRLAPSVNEAGESLRLEQKFALAEAMLRNLGLTSDMAPIVVICGHASDTVNNPYRAGLDCGACGGHSGESNARVAASILNDEAVRAHLRGRGFDVPDDVQFVPAVHHTTTDHIELLDLSECRPSHEGTILELKSWLVEAANRARCERATRLGTDDSVTLIDRSRDWSEVRPEWGLAGNAAFIVAPRSRTAGLKLDGRTFMHSYDYKKDAGGKVLELIMTAPMVVANWINLQYYASTVDNRHYGSGNKVLHNVVGQLGILEGNGGDLMTGLPWQSLHDGRHYQHEPLRLLVVIEAPRESIDRVLDNHANVRDLVSNGWLTLTAIDGGEYFRFAGDHGWQSA